MKNLNEIRVLGLVGTFLAIAATLLSNYANDKKTSQEIEKTVVKVVTEQLKKQ